MIDEEAKEKLRTATVEVLLEMRSAYLRTGQANTLKHWEILQNRTRAAARTCATPEKWATKLQRDLQIQSLGKSGSQVLTDLVHEVTELVARTEWLDLVEKEIGYLMAMARLTSEQRKEQQ